MQGKKKCRNMTGDFVLFKSHLMMNSSSPSSMTPEGTAGFLLNCNPELWRPLPGISPLRDRQILLSFNPLLPDLKTRERRQDFPAWIGRKVFNIFRSLTSVLLNENYAIKKYTITKVFYLERGNLLREKISLSKSRNWVEGKQNIVRVGGRHSVASGKYSCNL